MKAALTPRIQACVWTRYGHRTESDTDILQTRRPCQRRQDEIRSECHHGPVHTHHQTSIRRKIENKKHQKQQDTDWLKVTTSVQCARWTELILI